jgi:hypothetical protein
MPLLRLGGANIWFEQEELLGKSTQVLHRLIVGDAPERAKSRGAALPNQHGRTVLNLTDSELLTRFTDGKSLAFDKVGLCKALRNPGSAGPAATTLDGKFSSSSESESGTSGSESEDESSSDSDE